MRGRVADREMGRAASGSGKKAARQGGLGVPSYDRCFGTQPSHWRLVRRKELARQRPLGYEKEPIFYSRHGRPFTSRY